MNGLSLSGHQSGDRLRIVLAGELDLAAVPDVQVALEALVQPGMTVALDLDGLEFVDAAGLGVLSAAAEASRRDGWTLTLDGAPAQLRAISSICGLREHLPLRAGH